MARRVQDKVAVVTGAARGMGAAQARALAVEGAKVVLADIDAETAEERAGAIGDAGLDALGHHVDVASEDSWRTLVSTTENAFGTVDVLVNNAGVYEIGGAEDTSRDTWDRIVEVNQTGAWLGMQAVLPGMRAAGRGSIINLSSIHGLVGSTTGFAYHASKGAVRMMTKQVAVQHGPEGVRANSVCPALVHSPMNAQLDLAALMDMTPLRRGAQAEEVAAAVLFLASDEASYITGTELVVDGGFTAQ